MVLIKTSHELRCSLWGRCRVRDLVDKLIVPCLQSIHNSHSTPKINLHWPNGTHGNLRFLGQAGVCWGLALRCKTIQPKWQWKDLQEECLIIALLAIGMTVRITAPMLLHICKDQIKMRKDGQHRNPKICTASATCNKTEMQREARENSLCVWACQDDTHMRSVPTAWSLYPKAFSLSGSKRIVCLLHNKQVMSPRITQVWNLKPWQWSGELHFQQVGW